MTMNYPFPPTRSKVSMTGTEVINEQSRAAMRNAPKRIQTGEYAKMFIQEGKPTILQ